MPDEFPKFPGLKYPVFVLEAAGADGEPIYSIRDGGEATSEERVIAGEQEMGSWLIGLSSLGRITYAKSGGTPISRLFFDFRAAWLTARFMPPSEHDEVKHHRKLMCLYSSRILNEDEAVSCTIDGLISISCRWELKVGQILHETPNEVLQRVREQGMKIAEDRALRSIAYDSFWEKTNKLADFVLRERSQT